MKWTNDKSIKLSIACVFAFAAILLAVDISTIYEFVILAGIIEGSSTNPYGFLPFCVTVFSGSIFAWMCLWNLYSLLKNLQKSEVFSEGNVQILRRISWCCAGAAAVCLLSTLYAWPFFVVAIAAAFMMLIVRIVKNCFSQAVEMKSELDLTI